MGKVSFSTENRKPKTENFASGCLLCGSPLTYLNRETTARCVYCHEEDAANALCRQGHYVCDACHSREALTVIEHLLLTTRETDMLALLQEIRRHPAIPMHGPEHHSLVPGIILAVYRNLGGPVTPEMLQTALRRGKSIAGGACAFLGVCGAPAGLGVAFSLLLGANPVKSQTASMGETDHPGGPASLGPNHRRPLLSAGVLAGPASGSPASPGSICRYHYRRRPPSSAVNGNRIKNAREPNVRCGRFKGFCG